MPYQVIRSHDIRKGRYPVKVILQYWDDEKKEPFVDIYTGVPSPNGTYKHNHVKITSSHLWNRIRSIIESEIRHVKAGKPVSAKVVEKEVEQEMKSLKEDNTKLRMTLQAHTALLREYRKEQFPRYEQDLKHYEQLLKKARKEQELQKFLGKTPWLLGLEYDAASPQKISVGQRYDFYVEKWDGYADIIEIKKPGNSLFEKNGKISSHFGKALQQIVEYVDDAIAHGDSKRLSRKLQLHFLKPKGILIIGRRQDVEKQKNLTWYFHNIEILTYDDVLERGKSTINNLKKTQQKSKKPKKRKGN